MRWTRGFGTADVITTVRMNIIYAPSVSRLHYHFRQISGDEHAFDKAKAQSRVGEIRLDRSRAMLIILPNGEVPIVCGRKGVTSHQT
jgi:hypothetical protein